jgi:hypothetical protein
LRSIRKYSCSGPAVANDVAGVGVAEQLEHALGLLVQGLHGAQQRGLLVQRLAGPRQNAVGMHSVVPFGFSRM